MLERNYFLLLLNTLLFAQVFNKTVDFFSEAITIDTSTKESTK